MDRRGFIKGMLAAPVVIRTPGLLMPVKKIITTQKRLIRVRTGLPKVTWGKIYDGLHHPNPILADLEWKEVEVEI